MIDHMGDLQVPDGINNPAFKAMATIQPRPLCAMH